MPNISFTVDESNAGIRLDKFLSRRFPEKTRSYITKHIQAGHISVNGLSVKPGYAVHAGDRVAVDIPVKETQLKAAPIPLDIVHEDESILVVNKPPGLTVHPGNGTENDTLVNGLLHYTDKLAFYGQSNRPGIVHRLDKNTSGLLVIARNDEAHRFLQKQFDTRQIKRVYSTLVWGIPGESSGTIHTFINRSRKDPTKMRTTRDKGKEAVTHWRLIKEYLYFALLEVRLDTGRTHQIRVHMASIHHPVVGDPEYNGREKQLMRLPDNLRKRGAHLLKQLNRQFLHAGQLSFIHPLDKKEVTFNAPLPTDLATTCQHLKDWFLL